MKENKESFNSPSAYSNNAKQVQIMEVTDPRKNLVAVETNKIKEKNLKKILAHELSKSTGVFRPEFLKQHKLSADVRTRMVS